GLGLRLAKLGRLLDKPQWVDEGIATVRQSLKDVTDANAANDAKGGNNGNAANAGNAAPAAGGGNDKTTERAISLAESAADLLSEAGGPAEALAVLNDLHRRLHPARQGGGSASAEDATGLLVAMLGVYHQAGRPRDVLAMLDDVPYWPTADLAGVYSLLDRR